MTLIREDLALAPELLTGIPVVDEEHGRLRQLITLLEKTCSEYGQKRSCAGCDEGLVRACDASLVQCICDVIGFMSKHFAEEESFMKMIGIPTSHRELYLSHVEDHADMSDAVATLAQSVTENPAVVNIWHMASILIRWLDDHIRKHDLLMLT